MNPRVRLAALAAAVVVLAIVLLPRLVGRFESSLEASQKKAAHLEALYHDMTNALPIASEMPPDHPAVRQWQECRTKLFEAGYLETRELPLQNRLEAKGATWAFFKAFQARFPGVECGIRGAKTDQAVAIVTAPKANFGLFGAMENFVRQFQFAADK